MTHELQIVKLSENGIIISQGTCECGKRQMLSLILYSLLCTDNSRYRGSTRTFTHLFCVLVRLKRLDDLALCAPSVSDKRSYEMECSRKTSNRIIHMVDVETNNNC